MARLVDWDTSEMGELSKKLFKFTDKKYKYSVRRLGPAEECVSPFYHTRVNFLPQKFTVPFLWVRDPRTARFLGFIGLGAVVQVLNFRTASDQDQYNPKNRPPSSAECCVDPWPTLTVL